MLSTFRCREHACFCLPTQYQDADTATHLTVQAVAIKDGTIRVAFGIEDADDLVADFQQALAACRR